MKIARVALFLGALTFVALAIVLTAAQSRSLSQTGVTTDEGLPLNSPRLAPAQQKYPVKFSTAVQYSLTDGAAQIVIGDLNGDGKADVVVATYGGTATSGTVEVLLGNGDGTFQPAVSYGSGGNGFTSVAIADMNGDGKPDIVTANQCQTVSNYQCSGTGTVGVLLGNGDGTFQPVVTYSSGGYGAESVAVGDLNRDGLPDVVVANDCGSLSQYGCHGPAQVSVLLNVGNGSLGAAVSYSSGGYSSYGEANSIGIADLNGDGNLDLAVSNSCQSLNEYDQCEGDGVVGVLLGNSDGTFQEATSYDVGWCCAVSVAIGDLNRDGRLDLAVVDCCGGEVSILLGNGDGTFQSASVYPSGGVQANSVTIGDLNGDGYPDLVVSNNSLTRKTVSGIITIFVGNGDGTFQQPIVYKAGGKFTHSAAIADLNGDGKLDIVTGNYGPPPTAGVLLNILAAQGVTNVLTSSANPSQAHNPVTFTATLTSRVHVPDGSEITFYNGTTKLGTTTTKNGVTALTTSFSAGTYTIKVSYRGDAFHQPKSATLKQVVN